MDNPLDNALYENLLECLRILDPLDTPGEPNTLISLCEKAMRLINEPVSIQTDFAKDRQFLIAMLVEAGYIVWTEVRETINPIMFYKEKKVFVCFKPKNQK